MNHYGNHRTPLHYEELYRAAPSIFATEPAGVVSKEYQFIPTIQVVGDLADSGWFPVEAREQAVRKAGRDGFQKHMIRFGHADNDAAVPVVGGTVVEMVLTTAHDGTAAFRFQGGVFRFVCANGMVVGTDLVEPVSIKHIGYQATQALEAAHGLIANTEALKANIAAMREKLLPEPLRYAFAEQAARLRWNPMEQDEQGREVGFPIQPRQLLQPRRQDDTSGDLWTIFNVVQENLIGRAGLRGRAATGRRIRTRPVGALDAQVRINQRLWSLADSYLQAA